MFHDPVIWTAIGILSATWTEYSRQQIPADDGRQWQTEWISWAVIFGVAPVALFVRSCRICESAVQEGHSDSSTPTVGNPDVLAVAVANAVAHSLFLYFELHWALVRPLLQNGGVDAEMCAHSLWSRSQPPLLSFSLRGESTPFCSQTRNIPLQTRQTSPFC
jgi:hypothetical protein